MKKGKIIFSITETGNVARYGKAYVSKHVIKSVLHSIMFGMFQRQYPDSFTDFGGSVKNGMTRGRKFSVKVTERGQYQFTIQEGPGKLTSTGAIKLTKTEHTVTTFLSSQEAFQMAHEVYDYIQTLEQVEFA